MSGNNLSREEQLGLKEYDFADRLRSDYFKHTWVATSVLIPVCFGLVTLSYTPDLLNLRYELIPLALASICLYVIWSWYDWRYSGYMKTTYRRLRQLEKDTLKPFYLHRKIKDEDPTNKNYNKCRKLGVLKWVMFVGLIAIWALRIFFNG